MTFDYLFFMSQRSDAIVDQDQRVTVQETDQL